MRWIPALAAMLFAAAAGPARADESSGAEALENAVGRGLAFLKKDALAWRAEHQCASCHHASLVVWAIREAKEGGFDVESPFLEEMTQWLAESSGDGTTSVPRPPGIPKALNVKAIQYTLALEANPSPAALESETLTRLLTTIARDQTENGSWAAWPETRPPFFGPSDSSMTALAALALAPAAGRGAAGPREAVERAVRWLETAPPDGEAQALAMRLALWSRTERPEEERAALVRQVEASQDASGGWRQTGGMESDAWATGQALYALALAGVKGEAPAAARGRAFLLKTQREDGSWPMTSRPIKPGGEGSSSLIPITGGGSAWAVLGLVKSR